MLQGQLFVALLLTAFLTVSGVNEIIAGKYPLGAILLAIPACYWASVFYGVNA